MDKEQTNNHHFMLLLAIRKGEQDRKDIVIDFDNLPCRCLECKTAYIRAQLNSDRTNAINQIS